MSNVLAIEGGGSGFRAAKVNGLEIKIIAALPQYEISGGSLIAFIKRCTEMINADRIGISTSGFVTPDGVIEHSTNIGLPPCFPLAEEASRTTGKPTRVVNDLVAATRGISLVFPSLPRFIVENIGDGDGQNEYDNGVIKPIDERGHMTIDPSPFALPCSCGLYGCAESLVGGASMARLVEFTMSARHIDRPEGMPPCAFLDQEYATRAPWAVRIYNQFCLALGVKLANLQLGGKFPAFVFRGTTIVKALKLPNIEDNIRKSLYEHLPAKSWADVEFRIVPAHPQGIKDWDGFLGAAAFAED